MVGTRDACSTGPVKANEQPMAVHHILALAGLGAAVLAAVTWRADRRRMRRENLDKVGWVPWTGLFMLALLAAVVLLALAAKAWVSA